MTTRSAAEALEKVEREHFDLYFCDLRLPDMDGLELCRRVRALDPHAPVFICSGDARKSVQQQALEAGACAFIVKPIDPLELLQQIKASLSTSDVLNSRGKASASQEAPKA